MKKIIIVMLFTITFSGCIYKQTKTNSQGVVIEEKYIIKRPVKDFIEKVEFE